MTRLAYVCADPGVPPDGVKGASVHYREMGKALKNAGVDVHGFTRQATSSAFDEFPVTTPRQVRAGESRDRATDPVARELEQLVSQSAMLHALDDSGPFDAVYERYSLFGLAGLTHARRQGVPYFLEVNAPLWEEARDFRGLQTPELARAVALELCQQATRVLVVSDSLRRRLEAEGVPASRIRVFPNGVAPRFLEAVKPAARPASLTGKRILVFVGSLKPWHGIEFLLQAFAERPRDDIGLWVVGDGPLRPAVGDASRSHPDRIAWEGAVDHGQVPAILAAADAAVAPYTTASPDYFCPLKVVEALAAGLPLIASDVPAVRDVWPQVSGVTWFEPDSVSALGRAVDSLFSDLGRVRASAALDRELVRRHFTWEARACELAQWIDHAPCTRVGAAA